MCLLWQCSKFWWMLIIVPGLAVAWDIVRQADNFSLWTYVSCCLQRDILVYLYPSYWISFYFLNFLQQLFFFRFWETGGGGGYIQSWLWCFLLKREQKFLCARFCVLGAVAGGAIPTCSLSSVTKAPGQQLCVHQGKLYFSSASEWRSAVPRLAHL